MAALQRRIGTARAVFIGLASMVGAGVFFVWAPAAKAAGSGLLIGLVIAAVVATLNALSTTQLAMAHPISGGSYSYARATIGENTGFVAGLLFLLGKTASVSAIALVAGSYLWAEHARLFAVLVVAAFAIINMSGLRSTAAVSVVIVCVVFAGLVVTLLLGRPTEVAPFAGLEPNLYGILQSAGLLFFCFAGYARMATLGEEVVEPRRTLPRAILTALTITLALYAAIGIVLVSSLGIPALAESTSPLADLVGGSWDVVIRAVAGLACLGSLIGILAALSRTVLAMARGGDLPGVLGFIWSRSHAPVLAEGVIALVAIAAVLLLEPARLVGFSSCAVLVYYAIAHASALRQPAAGRWLPRWLPVLGGGGCLLLAATLPWQAILLTAAVAAVGLALRLLVSIRRRGRLLNQR